MKHLTGLYPHSGSCSPRARKPPPSNSRVFARRGGRVARAAWLPDSAVFKMFQVMRPFMPAPPSPAPPSPFEWGSTARVRALLAGDFDLRFEQGVATYFARDGVEAWDAFVTGYGPTKALARSIDDSRRSELKQVLIAFHDSYETELGISVPRQYLITLVSVNELCRRPISGVA
jgi:hypothetical protein